MKTDESTAVVSVAVVDDDIRVGQTIATYLKQLECKVTMYTCASDCLAALSNNPSDIVVSDIRMPGIDGLELLGQIRELSPQTDVIMVSGAAEKAEAIRALKLGAFDFFEKPVDGDELIETIRRTLRYRALIAERDRYASQVTELTQREAQAWRIDGFIGKTKAIRECLRTVRLLQTATKTSVLITGESGTGKELIARALHFGSDRASRPFMPLNCSAVPKELAESTLFGHRKGAFTGAVSDRKGCFEMADGGTLFLDEIGDMPTEMQTKLLRVLEDGIVTPVGASTGHHVDVRVVAATNADLNHRIASREFRQDLFYRIASFQIHVPALRDRRSDIPLLVEHFVRKLSEEMGLADVEIEPAAMEMMRSHAFPGNIRELRNVIERALIECSGTIRPAHIHLLSSPLEHASESTLRPTPRDSQPAELITDDLPLDLQEAETLLIRKAIHVADGNMSLAARLLGISRPKLYRKLAIVQGVVE